MSWTVVTFVIFVGNALVMAVVKAMYNMVVIARKYN